MNHCRVCASDIATTAYEASAPALTSVMTILDMPTQVFVCDTCGHAQCADLPDIQTFYDTGYKISLGSEDHDQIFAVATDGTPIFRTDHQAALALRLFDLPEGASLLDYGAAKATTLRKIFATRPDLQPHVFDVSSDYASAWQGWIEPENQAIYSTPSQWAGRFDAIMTHFVLEHVAEPVAFLSSLHDMLKVDGRLLVSIPDVAANPGDMAVVDHLNHFSDASLRYAFAKSGLIVETMDRTSFPGAFFVVATRPQAPVIAERDQASALQAADRSRGICDFWTKAAQNLDDAVSKAAGRSAAIYGAGFYGSWIFSRMEKHIELRNFLDQNPKLHGTEHFGRPVIAPAQLPIDIEIVFIGLNPLKAREAIAALPALHREGLELVWIDA
ncbi:methyltransferase domain-containing protein [Pararhizobium sp. PWRC1-1]|uniref:methyltransferase domain-containing protein n=1 Tax=Pararhizobium sp. PWRC1-1 TaxID=2804566 RepID=UPI003CF687BB